MEWGLNDDQIACGHEMIINWYSAKQANKIADLSDGSQLHWHVMGGVHGFLMSCLGALKSFFISNPGLCFLHEAKEGGFFFFRDLIEKGRRREKKGGKCQRVNRYHDRSDKQQFVCAHFLASSVYECICVTCGNFSVHAATLVFTPRRFSNAT